MSTISRSDKNDLLILECMIWGVPKLCATPIEAVNTLVAATQYFPGKASREKILEAIEKICVERFLGATESPGPFVVKCVAESIRIGAEQLHDANDTPIAIETMVCAADNVERSQRKEFIAVIHKIFTERYLSVATPSPATALPAPARSSIAPEDLTSTRKRKAGDLSSPAVPSPPPFLRKSSVSAASGEDSSYSFEAPSSTEQNKFDIADTNGNTSLHLALMADNVHSNTIIQRCKGGADSCLQNRDGDTPLHLAVRKHPHTVIHFLNHSQRGKIDLTIKNKAGHTCVEEAKGKALEQLQKFQNDNKAL